MFGSLFSSRAIVLAQALGGLAALVVVGFTPPVRGEMILIPLAPHAGDGLVALAVARGARLVGRGPVGQSLVVYGERARLLSPMAARGVLTIAAPTAGCSSRPPEPVDDV